MPSRIPVSSSRFEPPPDPNRGKLTICLDFHGVIHSHRGGNRSADIDDDPPVPGAFEFLELACEVFRVAIVSARFSDPGPVGLRLRKSAQEWFARHGCRLRIGTDPLANTPVYLASVKPPCHVFIDDRSITFNGTFPSIDSLQDFRPWNRP